MSWQPLTEDEENQGLTEFVYRTWSGDTAHVIAYQVRFTETHVVFCGISGTLVLAEEARNVSRLTPLTSGTPIPGRASRWVKVDA